MSSNSTNDNESGPMEATRESNWLAAAARPFPPAAERSAMIPQEHSDAVRRMAEARLHARAGRRQEAKSKFREAARLEQYALLTVMRQPDRALIAEAGAHSALRAGDYGLARELARRGFEYRATEAMQWALLRTLVQADLLQMLERFGYHGRVDWEALEEDEAQALIIHFGDRTAVFELEPGSNDAWEREIGQRALTIALPAAPLDGATLDRITESVEQWLRPRARAQTVRQRGIWDDFIPEFALA